LYDKRKAAMKGDTTGLRMGMFPWPESPKDFVGGIMILGRLRALIKRLVWKDDIEDNIMMDDEKFYDLFAYEEAEAADAEREEEIV
jgi:hypothetical protein